jgi:hypothetical protein
MSYNVAICSPPIPTDDAQAWVGLEAATQATDEVPAAFKQLFNGVFAGRTE